MVISEEAKLALVQRLEDAYKSFHLSEMYLKDVSDDYGKQKIASLRYEFAKHHFMEVWQEALNNGVEMEDSEPVKSYFARN